MNFKSIIGNDIKNVFFNIEEFSEIHNINGKNIEIVKDEDKLNKINSLGVKTGDILFYVNIDVLKEKNIILNPGKTIIFDGRQSIVNSNNEDLGVCEIILGFNY